MQIFDTRHWLALLLLPLVLVGCTGGSSEDRGRTPSVTVKVQGQYTRKVLGPNGFTSLETRPTRYAVAEVLRRSDFSVLGKTVLDANGQGLVDVPQGEEAFLSVYAQVAVPASDGNSFFMQGSVKGIPRANGTIPQRKQVYQGIDEFQSISNWYCDSSPTIINAGTTLHVSPTVDKEESGAFNIADQMVTFAKGVERVAPTLTLPNLHAWWSSGIKYGDYPKVAEYQDGKDIFVMSQRDSGRYVFQFDVRNYPTDPDPKAPAFNDSALQEAMTRMLFADFSDQAVKPNANGFVPSILRRDNDNVSISRGFATDSTAAFVAGASDFLSSAFRGSSVMYDVRTDGSVGTFDLTYHNPFNRAADGEFYREGVCLSLQGIWKNVLGGGDSGLRTMWSLMRSSNLAMAYPNAPLGCYPTFLVGLRNVSGVNWGNVLYELAQEKIQDVTTVNYLNGTALWIQTSVPVAKLTGSLHTYNPSVNSIYYDRDQSQAFRFTQNWVGNRTFTMTPTGGQDCWLELIGPGGVLVKENDSRQAGQVRQIKINNLPAGDYVVRVRVGDTTANGFASFELRVD